MTFDRSALKEAKRIVVKVGTSTITYANGKRNFEQIDWPGNLPTYRIRVKK